MDARYGTTADHRQEIRALRREVEALRNEVVRLRNATQESFQTVKRVSDNAVVARRLATEGAKALDEVLQSEMRIWQAIDTLASQVPDADHVR
jgi:hypothetical protein